MEDFRSVESQMKMNTVEYIEEFEEDDLFYAELRERYLLLTAEDDDDVEEFQKNKLKSSAKTLQQRFKNSAASALQHGCYYNWSGDEATESVPKWLFNLWKSGNGTGVFIPQIIKSRPRYKPKRQNNVRGRIYKAVAEVKA